MPIVVKPVTQRSISIRLNRLNSGLFQQSGLPVEIQSQIAARIGVADLIDVDLVNLVDGASLVYNATTQLYELRVLDIGDLDFPTEIDGGDF